MNLTKKNIQKTSGIHRLGKFYKPGQLGPSKCRYFGCWGHVPINCYFKLVK